MSSSSSPSSAAFRFPALRTSQVAGAPTKTALTTGSSPSRPRSRSSPGDRALTRIDKHSKNRSHFSIPDVMVTAAEEDGEEVYFEVEVPNDDRRMKLHTDSAVEDGVARQSQGEGEDPDVEQPPRKSLGGKMMPFLRRESSERDEVRGAVATTPQNPTGPASRVPKKAMSGIFGKKEKKVEMPAPAVSASAKAMVPRSNSPYGHSGSAFDSSGSLPLLSSKDSLPSSSTSSHFPRTPPANETTFPEGPSGKQSAPVMSAVSNSTMTAGAAATKKQRKANQREELALMKELAKIDKMVREHDARAKKEAAAAAIAATASAKTPSRMMTIFAARKKGSAPARKVSVVRRSASNAGREPKASGQYSNSSSNKAYTSASTAKAHTATHSGTSRAAEPPASAPIRSSLDGGERSDDSDGPPSFSGVEWSTDLPASALAGKSGIHYPGLSTDDTIEFTLSSDSELPVGVTLPREDSAVIPLAAVAAEGNDEEVDEEEGEVESVSPSSTWSEGIHAAEGEEQRQEGVVGSALNRPEVDSSPAASPVPLTTPLTRQVSPPETSSTVPVRPPRRQNSAPPTGARDDGTSSRPPPLQSVSTNKARGPGNHPGQTMSFKPGQIIPDTLPSATGTRCDSPSLRYASKLANGSRSGSGPTEYAPFRAAMMTAGPAVVADRAGQRM